MQYVIIAIVVVAIALGLGMLFWKKKAENIESENKALIVGTNGDIIATDSSTVNEITIQMGEVSREQCTALLPTYIKQASDSLAILADWHNGNVTRLAIDTRESKRKRQGFDGVIHWIPGLFDESHNYASVADGVIEMINVQSTEVDHEARLSKL